MSNWFVVVLGVMPFLALIGFLIGRHMVRSRRNRSLDREMRRHIAVNYPPPASLNRNDRSVYLTKSQWTPPPPPRRRRVDEEESMPIAAVPSDVVALGPVVQADLIFLPEDPPVCRGFQGGDSGGAGASDNWSSDSSDTSPSSSSDSSSCDSSSSDSSSCDAGS